MSRMIWKGAISFGLVPVPVGLYPASDEIGGGRGRPIDAQTEGGLGVRLARAAS